MKVQHGVTSTSHIISLGEEWMPATGSHPRTDGRKLSTSVNGRRDVGPSNGGYPTAAATSADGDRGADSPVAGRSPVAVSGPPRAGPPRAGASCMAGPAFHRAPDPRSGTDVIQAFDYAAGGGSSGSTAPLTNLARTTSSGNSALRVYDDIFKSLNKVGEPDTSRCRSSPQLQTLQSLSGSWAPLQNLAAGQTAVPESSEVTLHVYDLHSVTKRMNIATFHLGIEVYGQEIFFSVEGILSCMPAGHKRHIHRESLLLGRTCLRTHEVKLILEEMGKEWKGNSYSVIGRNCQTFAVAFAEHLGLGSDIIPTEYRRQSDLGSCWRDTTLGGAAATVLNRMFGSAGSQTLASGGSVGSGSGAAESSAAAG